MAQESYPEPKPPPIVLVTDDPVLRRRCEAAARDLEIILLPFRRIGDVDIPAPPRAFIVDLREDGAFDAISGWKERFGSAPVIAVISIPDAEVWTRAEDAGADFVATRGTVHRQLPDLLATFAQRAEGLRRIRVAPANEFDGRLGYVGSVIRDVPEEVALYHVGYELCAVSNVCPHAGAKLSDGELSDGVITCPLHGSQFDVCSGDRLRGPADDPLRHYEVVTEDGFVFVTYQEG